MSYLLVFFGFSQALPFLNDHTPVQSDFTKFGLFSIYTIIPAVLNLISIVPILFYKLSGKKMADIQSRLAVKRLEDAKRLEGIVDEETKGETDIYSVVAEEERKQELKEEARDVKEVTTDAQNSDSDVKKEEE